MTMKYNISNGFDIFQPSKGIDIYSSNFVIPLHACERRSLSVMEEYKLQVCEKKSRNLNLYIKSIYVTVIQKHRPSLIEKCFMFLCISVK
jgi:hypothetical protein